MCMAEGHIVKEAIKEKSGVDLFRELLRRCSTVVLEDYYKNGVWLEDLLRLDIEILHAHRVEAGAPEMPPAESLKVPDIPVAPPRLPMMMAMRPMMGMTQVQGQENSLAITNRLPSNPGTFPAAKSMALPGVQPKLPSLLSGNGIPGGAAGTAGAGSPVAGGAATAPTLIAPLAIAAASDPALSKQAGIAAPKVQGLLPPQVGGAAAQAADQQQVGIFISRWQLEPSRAQALLGVLPPARRAYVIRTFMPLPVNGMVPIAKLEDYIAQCERSNVWPAPSTMPSITSSMAPASGMSSPGVVTVKRTFDQAGLTTFLPSKRPAMGLPTKSGFQAAPRPVPRMQAPPRPVSPGACGTMPGACGASGTSPGSFFTSGVLSTNVPANQAWRPDMGTASAPMSQPKVQAHGW